MNKNNRSDSYIRELKNHLHSHKLPYNTYLLASNILNIYKMINNSSILFTTRFIQQLSEDIFNNDHEINQYVTTFDGLVEIKLIRKLNEIAKNIIQYDYIDSTESLNNLFNADIMTHHLIEILDASSNLEIAIENKDDESIEKYTYHLMSLFKIFATSSIYL